MLKNYLTIEAKATEFIYSIRIFTKNRSLLRSGFITNTCNTLYNVSLLPCYSVTLLFCNCYSVTLLFVILLFLGPQLFCYSACSPLKLTLLFCHPNSATLLYCYSAIIHSVMLLLCYLVPFYSARTFSYIIEV